MSHDDITSQTQSFLLDSTEHCKDLLESERKALEEDSALLHWLAGLSSAAFLLMLSAVKDLLQTKRVSPDDKLFVLASACFFLLIVSVIGFRFALKRRHESLYTTEFFYNFQCSHLKLNPTLLTKYNSPISFHELLGRLMYLQELPKEMLTRYLSNRSTTKGIDRLSGVSYWLAILSLISQFGALGLLFKKAYLV